MRNEKSFGEAIKFVNENISCKESKTYFAVVDCGDGYGGASNCDMKDMSSLITHGLAEHMDLLLRSDSSLAKKADEILYSFELILYDAIDLVADSLRLKWVDNAEFADGLHGFIAKMEENQWCRRGVGSDEISKH